MTERASDLEPAAEVAHGSELRPLLQLAWPLMIGYAGNTLLGVVDTAMVGRLGGRALAAVSIGNGLFFALSLAGMGLLNGMDPLASQAMGAGERTTARRVLWQGVRVALVLAAPLVALTLLLTLGLEPFGVEHETAVLTRSFLYGRVANVVPFLLFAVTRSYLQATGKTRPIVISMVVANIVNFVFDGLFVFGDRALAYVGLPAIGFPALGPFGAGLASTLASCLSFVVMARGVASVETPPDPERRTFDRELTARLVRLGLPIAGQILAEVGIFTLTTLLAGRMGTLPVAGNTIAFNLASFTFTVSLGLASATTVRVGRAVGRKDSAGARRAGFTGLFASSAFMALAALSFLVIPEPLARVLTNQPEVIAAALPLIHIGAVFQLSDGAQVTMANALRGIGDTRYTQTANLIGHYAIGLPVALALAYGARLGASGLWWGLTAGLTAVAALLTWRFNRLSKGFIARA